AMALVDDVIIKIKAGDGGNGGRAFHTNFGSIKSVPDGGNGGYGGDVFFEGDSNLNDLSEFRYRKSIKAENGVRGKNKSLNGAKGKDAVILVPLGTTIIDINSQDAFEILKHGDRVLAAAGGRGGSGNAEPTIKINRYDHDVPSLLGQPGEARELHLVLNLIADIGLVGLPNAGKSSLLKTVTRATPKIGNYPFTTLEPNLGTMGKITLADIPGLVEGASEGKGLGIEFLKHIEKTKVLVHCIDSTVEDPYKAYQVVHGEFESYNKKLLSKKEIIFLTKIDLIEPEDLQKKVKMLAKTKKEIYTVSIYDQKSVEGIEKILRDAVNTQVPDKHSTE
ncbi:MAG: Obg family GTPase CgtA, partial [Candidatus Levyibacteriota bacterium]